VLVLILEIFLRRTLDDEVVIKSPKNGGFNQAGEKNQQATANQI